MATDSAGLALCRGQQHTWRVVALFHAPRPAYTHIQGPHRPGHMHTSKGLTGPCAERVCSLHVGARGHPGRAERHKNSGAWTEAGRLSGWLGVLAGRQSVWLGVLSGKAERLARGSEREG
eukprot:11435-Chlamydomonas_euryale.AAC.1